MAGPVVAVLAVLAVLTAGCGGDAAPAPGRAAAEPATATAAATATTAPGPAVLDVTALPQGPPPRVDHLADGRLTHAGRTVATDFPRDALYAEILGAVDGAVVVTAYQGAGAQGGDRFWAIDRSGHARRLGGTYRSYDYAPRLVAGTGHLWVHYEDRTSPRTIWEVDARTGRQLAAYDHGQVPHGLAAADQALVDAWVARRRAVPDTEATTRDGSLRATTRSVNPDAGTFVDEVVVRRSADRSVAARFDFARTEVGEVDRVVFEDRAHILVLVTVSATRRDGAQQVIVRCSVDDGSCERATELGGTMALGVVRPVFVPRHQSG